MTTKSTVMIVIMMIITITMTITTTNRQVLCSLKLHRCQAHQMTRRGEAAEQLQGHDDHDHRRHHNHQIKHSRNAVFDHFSVFSCMQSHDEAKGREFTPI